MAPNGARKAAMLLMSLDPPTAAELLRSASPETVTEIAAELAYLGRAGETRDADRSALIGEFFGVLSGQKRAFGGEDFVREMLKIIHGEEESQSILQQVNERVNARDPFLEIRSAQVSDIAGTLADESPQMVSVVISELPPSKSAELLACLDEEIRAHAIRCMASGDEVSREARLRVASVVQSRLAQTGRFAGTSPAGTSGRLRKVAVLLRGLTVDIRDSLVKSLADQDNELAESVQKLMVVWEDLPDIAERSLQEVLRSVDAGKLALALVDADELTATKIRENVSERARAMIDEEVSLLSAPRPDEVTQAREEILGALRNMNASGELQFV